MKTLSLLDFVATSTRCSDSDSGELCAGSGTSSTCCGGNSSTGLSWNAVNPLRIPANESISGCCSSCLEACSSRRYDTESLNEQDATLFPEACDASGSNDSGDGVVQDESLPVLLNNPGRNCLFCR